jgi:hypothetical protein
MEFNFLRFSPNRVNQKVELLWTRAVYDKYQCQPDQFSTDNGRSISPSLDVMPYCGILVAFWSAEF